MPKAARALGDGPADAPEADDRQPRAAQLEPEPAPRLPRAPAAVADGRLRLGQAAGRGEQQREREVGGRVGERRRASRPTGIPRASAAARSMLSQPTA